MSRAEISPPGLVRSLSSLLLSWLTLTEFRTPSSSPPLAGSSHLLNSRGECHSIFWLCPTPPYSALGNSPLAHGIHMIYIWPKTHLCIPFHERIWERSQVLNTSLLFWTSMPTLPISLLFGFHRCDSELDRLVSSDFQGAHIKLLKSFLNHLSDLKWKKSNLTFSLGYRMGRITVKKLPALNESFSK